MAKVTFILGLAGSGKTHLAAKIESETGAEYIEGTEGDDEIKRRMLSILSKGGSCIVEEVAYCLPSVRENITFTLVNMNMGIEIEWICFENDIESANWNVRHRTNKQDVEGHLHINSIYQGLYIYPGGAKPIPIFRINSGNTNA